jgi:hypothetical protein
MDTWMARNLSSRSKTYICSKKLHSKARRQLYHIEPDRSYDLNGVLCFSAIFKRSGHISLAIAALWYFQSRNISPLVFDVCGSTITIGSVAKCNNIEMVKPSIRRNRNSSAAAASGNPLHFLVEPILSSFRRLVIHSSTFNHR